MNPHIETLKQWLESRCEYHKDITELGWNTATTDAEIAALRAAIADMEELERLRGLLFEFLSNPIVKEAVCRHNDMAPYNQYIDLIASSRQEGAAMKGGE